MVVLKVVWKVASLVVRKDGERGIVMADLMVALRDLHWDDEMVEKKDSRRVAEWVAW